MSKLKSHYIRNLQRYGNLAVSHKTEIEIKEIVKELKDLGYDVDYRKCEDIPIASTLVTASVLERYYAERHDANWALFLRTSNKGGE